VSEAVWVIAYCIGALGMSIPMIRSEGRDDHDGILLPCLVWPFTLMLLACAVAVGWWARLVGGRK
jgi:hypothetical protein